MDRTEGGGSEGNEELRVLHDIEAHSLSTPDAGRYQLPGVSLVEPGARWAHGGPPVLARHHDPGVHQLAVDPLEATALQPDGMGTATGLVDLGQDLAPLRGSLHDHPADGGPP